MSGRRQKQLRAHARALASIEQPRRRRQMTLWETVRFWFKVQGMKWFGWREPLRVQRRHKPGTERHARKHMKRGFAKLRAEGKVH